MDPNLGTTNLLLGIMAAVSVIELLMIIGVGIAGYMMYRKTTQVLTDLEARHVAPLREKVETILGDVQMVTARVHHQTERVEHAISGTMDRVDETTERVRSSVREKVSQAQGVVRGVRAVIASLLTHEARPKPPAAAA